MNADILKNAGIDYDRGVKRFMGRTHLYEKSLSKFLKDSTFVRISTAYQAGDNEQLLAGAHEFKGMCGNIALDSLYQASDALVQMLRSGCTSQELSQAYGLLDREYCKVREAVCTALEVEQ